MGLLEMFPTEWRMARRRPGVPGRHRAADPTVVNGVTRARKPIEIGV